MLMEWLKPAIDKRLISVYAECDRNSEVAKASTAYHAGLEKVKEINEDLYIELEDKVSHLRVTEQDVTYRLGMTDGLALHQEISTIRLQPFTQNKEGGFSLEMVTRRLAETAKMFDKREWDLHDLLKRKKVDSLELHHVTDNVLEIIHDFNGLPKEGENGFCRDNWDDDFLAYFADDCDLDECLIRYAERLAALKL